MCELWHKNLCVLGANVSEEESFLIHFFRTLLIWAIRLFDWCVCLCVCFSICINSFDFVKSLLMAFLAKLRWFVFAHKKAHYHYCYIFVEHRNNVLYLFASCANCLVLRVVVFFCLLFHDLSLIIAMHTTWFSAWRSKNACMDLVNNNNDDDVVKVNQL